MNKWETLDHFCWMKEHVNVDDLVVFIVLWCCGIFVNFANSAVFHEITTTWGPLFGSI